ncbi:hypothetical protein GA0070216_105410 [Micromonospora matsumotoense]|uniref:Uncharacterized protein n=1 Tax=Micromonospora matsumotoense TaxID=121616 RepID=A0A1C4Y6E1_9ACTN|nr:hypothetical protein [Micromonospora matsumotoense]SCF16293.1 hypothetical protein GA0070216_105410 [Micromonospora matsumotoense]
MTKAPWLLVIILFALLVGTVTAWIWSRSGATILETFKAGGSACAAAFGVGITGFYFLS